MRIQTNAMAATKLSSCLILLLFVTLLLVDVSHERRGKGSRRRKTSKQNSKILFHTNSKRAEYYLNDNGAQIIKSSHFDYEFDLGHKIIFICLAIGDPLPRIGWFKDGIELDNTINNHIHINNWKLTKSKNATIKSKLEIDPARQMDSGSYECVANNKYSTDRRNFKADF